MDIVLLGDLDDVRFPGVPIFGNPKNNGLLNGFGHRVESIGIRLRIRDVE